MLNILTTREIALGIWLLILLFWSLKDRNVRAGSKEVLKSFFVKSIQLSILALAVYVVIVVSILSRFGLWNESLLKDTIIWVLTVAFVMLVNVNSIKGTSYFKDTFKDTFKWTIILEFALTLYTFSLTIELILAPVFILLGVLHGFARVKNEYVKVKRLISASIV